MGRTSVLAAGALFGLFAAGGVQAQDLSLPPYDGVYEPQGVDERGLWMMADEGERFVRDSNFIIRDEELNAYVRDVFCETVGEDRCGNVRIYIARIPDFNATMSPNGMMVVWSGLLLRCRNEAELASVLAHEFAHFERRHSLAGFRRRRGLSDFLAWSAVLGAFSVYTSNVGLFAIGGYFEFSRSQEREADVLGLSYLSASTYRPQVAAEVWVRMMDEADASALGRHQRSRRYDRTPFFSTHPTQRDRATYLEELAGEEIPGRVVKAEEFASVMRPWVPIFLEDQLGLNDFGGSEFLLAQLAERDGWTSELLYFRGELFRMRGYPRDLVNAADFYRQSISLDDGRPEAFRGLGLALMRSREVGEAGTALQQYLSMYPEAPDAPMIQMLVDQAQ